MAEPIPDGSDAYRQVVRGLLALHRCIAAGREDSAEADAIRDSLDAPLLALSDSERARSQWLSEVLYSISDPGELGDSESSRRKLRRNFWNPTRPSSGATGQNHLAHNVGRFGGCDPRPGHLDRGRLIKMVRTHEQVWISYP